MNRPLQRLAAAAIVVVAVGIGYLTLRTDSGLKFELEGQSPVATEETESAFLTEGVEELQQRTGETGQEKSLAMRDNALAGSSADDSPTEEAAAPEPARRMARTIVGNDGEEAPALAAKEAKPRSDVADEEFAMADMDAFALDTAVLDEVGEAGELLSWDQEEEALRTFFWQVRALDRRSPAEEWEEAVPLEGSFEQLEKQQPGSIRWLQTGSER
jgi:hypothetical protein